MLESSGLIHRSLLTHFGRSVITASLLLTNLPASAFPIYADGDLAPLGEPDGRVDTADVLLTQQIVLAQIIAGESELSHGDVYPAGAPDGAITVQDLLLIQQRVLGQAGNSEPYIRHLDLFAQGPATATVTVGGVDSSTVLVAGGYTSPNATAISNPNAIDPQNSSNIIWTVNISGGTANVYLGTASLDSDPVLDSGFDFSGAGSGYLVFDIKVNSMDAGTALTVKMDSGYPKLGQRTLTPSQYTIGSWRRVAISFAELLANPGPGTGLELENVVNAFVIEVTGGAADFYLDNIFVSRTCPEVDGCIASVNSKDEPAIYSLVWSDEFDGTTLSSNNWAIETGYGSFGWGNDEWQLYTTSPNNVSVQGGNLVLKAQCASPPNCGKRNGTITSARINTLSKFAFKYGRVEARLKPPVGKGAWPAFWMLGKNFPQIGWPQSGEIDIMEMNNLYSNAQTTHFTVHFCDENKSDPCVYNPGWTYITDSETLPYSLGDGFHVFSADWDANGITGKIDNIPYFYLPIDPVRMDEFLKEFFLLLNVAIGGNLGGAPDASTPWPQEMLVDYVRVYQAEGGDGTYTIGNGPVSPIRGIYSETHTADMLGYTSIINAADFGGNVTNTNENSTSVPAYEGGVALAASFINTGSNYGGFIFNFNGGRDISAYETLNFAINTTGMPGMADMVIQIENPGGAQPAPKVFLDDYTPVSSSGDWDVYEIPLQDFTGQAVALNLGNMLYLGFWNPVSAGGQLQFGTLYFDNIHVAGGQ